MPPHCSTTSVCGEDAPTRALACARPRRAAARIGEAECARLQMTPAHKTKLLASARRPASGCSSAAAQCPARTAAAAAAARGEEEAVDAAAAQIHYDAETGECFDEAGMMDME